MANAAMRVVLPRRNLGRLVSGVVLTFSLWGANIVTPGFAQSEMESAPAYVVESGAPSFSVLSPETIGLSTPLVGLRQLPDGRILVVAQRELALGDGVRWEVYRSRPGEEPILGRVALGPQGQVYSAAEKGFVEIIFGQDGLWSRRIIERFPKSVEAEGSRITTAEMLSKNWFWYGTGGTIISWKPGEPSRVVGNVGSIERIFELGSDVLVSSQSSGYLFRLNADGTTTRLTDQSVASDTVTSAIPFSAGQLLVGTNGLGLKILDRDGVHPFEASEVLEGHRINDLISTGAGYFAAAVDTVGVVFFDREGKVVQTLDHSLDHRLGRVQRLRYASDGVLWAILNESIARIEFPSRISHFEPMLSGGLPYAQPMRHNGQLWIESDVRAHRAVYDWSGRLAGFESATPPGRTLFSLKSIQGRLFASNELGIYEWSNETWKLVVSGIVNTRLGIAGPSQDRWLYAAKDEIGWMHLTDAGVSLERFPVKGLGATYDTVEEAPGIVWLELGPGLLGRIDATQSKPKLRIFTSADGLTDGWSQVFKLEGVTRFNVNNRILRFNDRTGKFVEDQEFRRSYPELGPAPRRPSQDPLGRIWFSTSGAAKYLATEGGKQVVHSVDVGFEPYKYTVEKNGVVWMWGNQRLARFDPRLPETPPKIPVALITSVQLPESNRRLYAPKGDLGQLSYADNSPVFHFVAPGNSFGASTFEVLLEGAGTQWVPIGSVGVFALNRLKEGQYTFRVRPVSDQEIGVEANVSFVINPPWYRTRLAWILYAFSAIGVVVGVARLTSFLERREKERLARLVEERTAELRNQVNETVEKATALAASEERYRSLNAVLEGRVNERTIELAYERDLLRALLESSPDKIYFKDLQSRFIKCSVALVKSFNVGSVDELMGRTDFDFLAESFASAALDDERAIIQTGQPVIGKVEKEVWLDGRVTWVLTSKIPLRDSAGQIAGTIGIAKDITQLKATEAKLEEVHKQLLETSHQAGMAEVATSVLHNVGNVLNSVNVSATLVSDQMRRSKVPFVGKVAELFAAHSGNLMEFLTNDPKGRKIGPYLSTLSDDLACEQKKMGEELDHLRKKIEHIKEIVAMQQNLAQVSGVSESVPVTELVEDAMRINASSLSRHEVELVCEMEADPVVTIQRHKVMQVLINLIRNAKQACDDRGGTDKKITIRVQRAAERVIISVIDNGVGIPKENLTRIFAHGFSTKKDGHGFGLHSGALNAKELGGTLTARSDGPGQGATFVLDLPINAAGA
jgi:PAS domain S-box-containing protein